MRLWVLLELVKTSATLRALACLDTVQEGQIIKVPANLRGTTFRFVYLATGVALLIASIFAGSLWQLISPKAAFIAGRVFAVVAIAILLATRNRFNPQT